MSRVRSTARMESVRFLYNVHGRFTTRDGNTAQRTSTVERSPSAFVSSSTRTVSKTDQLVLLMAALMPRKNTQSNCIS